MDTQVDSVVARMPQLRHPSQWGQYSSDGDVMDYGMMFNVIGPCGVRPIGVGKKHREKLDKWEKCRDRAKDQKAEKKAAKIADKGSDAALIDALSTMGPAAPPPPGGEVSSSLMTNIFIGVAVTGVLVGGTILVIKLVKKKKKAA